MKNWIKSMFIVLCGMMVATTFVACGDDDDNEGGNTASLIVGTWMSNLSLSEEWIIFDSDHTGNSWTVDKYSGDVEEAFTFTWKVSGKTLKINPTGGNVGSVEVFSFTINSVSSTSLDLYNGEENHHYERVTQFIPFNESINQ